MENLELENAILDLVQQPNYRPIKPRVIAQRLHIPKPEAMAVKKAVKRLVARGQLKYGSNHLVQSAAQPASAGQVQSSVPGADRGTGASSSLSATADDKGGQAAHGTPRSSGDKKGNRAVGVFRRNDAGFGFVRQQPAVPGGPLIPDIYIAKEDSGDASSGDVVAVRLKHGRRGPGPRGEILEILERETHRFVGTYSEARGEAFIEVDGGLFSQPISVGDPGAHNVQENDKVVIEMVRFPSHVHRGEGVIVEVLGPRGEPGVDTLSVIREYDLPEEFPDDVLEEAREQAEQFNESVSEDRLDATGEVVITIDPADARDFDDAISLVQEDTGHWRLGVHIADVSHFVRPKTALDRDAYERATSVYLPDRVVPMLPELISNSLASLQPNKVRYTKTAYLEFTPEGTRVSTEIHSAAIKSRKRLNYDQVDEFLANPDQFRRKWGVQVCELLERMRTLAAILRRRRFERGALELTMPEVKIDLDKQGRVSGAHVVENTESHQIIEEFMLAANEAVAETLRDKGFLFLRRIHRPPSPLKLKALAEFIEALGLPADEVRSRFGLQDLLRQVVGRPEQHAVNYAILRSMQRAVYGPEDEGHYALSSDCYCHFTSPIRRYPDLTVHRLVEAVLRERKPHQNMGELLAWGEHCSDREHRADEAERELTKLKLLHYLSQRIGEEMDAVITGVESYGLFAQGVQLPAEGLIRVDALVDDYYQYDRAAHTLSGHRAGNVFRLGDPLRVAIARVDLERRQLDFRLIEREKRPPMAARLDGRRGRTSDRGGKKAKEARSSRKPTGRKAAGKRRR